jgi:hypothetical protein
VRKVFSLEGPPGDGETSRLGSRDPVDSGTGCRPHGGDTSKTKSWTIEPVHGGGRVKCLAGGRTEHAGFGGLPTKPSEDGFYVWASKPSQRAQHDGDGIRACREASRRRTRDGIAWLASGGLGVRKRRGRPMARPTNIT